MVAGDGGTRDADVRLWRAPGAHGDGVEAAAAAYVRTLFRALDYGGGGGR